MVRAIRRFWVLTVVVSLATFGGIVVALALVPKSYTSTAVVAMVPRPEAAPGGDLLRLSLPSYAYLATSEATAVDLAGRFDLDPDRIHNGVSAQIPPASNTLLLSATWSDPGTAARLANGLADVVRRETAGDLLLTASPLAEALPPATPSWPPWSASLVLGGLIGLTAGMVAAVVADRRRPLITSPAHVAALLQDEGLPAPVLLSENASGGTAAVVARAVESDLGIRDDEGIRWLALPVLGGDARQGVALAAGVAAELARHGRRVQLLVSERDAPLLDRHSISSTLARTSPGSVVTQVGAPATGSRTSGGGHEPGEADIQVQVTDGIEPVMAPASHGRTIGVVPVVCASAPTSEVQATLRLLHESGMPVPAVYCPLLPAAGHRAGRPRVIGVPSRAGSESPDVGPESDRGQPSPAGTGLKS
jgi:hypothetical protein